MTLVFVFEYLEPSILLQYLHSERDRLNPIIFVEYIVPISYSFFLYLSDFYYVFLCMVIIPFAAKVADHKFFCFHNYPPTFSRSPTKVLLTSSLRIIRQAAGN